MTKESPDSSPTHSSQDVFATLRERARIAIESNMRAKTDWAAYQKARTALEELGVQLPADLPTSLEAVKTGRSSSSTKVGKKKSGATWKSEILSIVRKHGEISYLDLREELADGPIGPKLKHSDKAFYNALSRLEASNELVRHNAHAFTPKVFEQYKNDVKTGARDAVEAEAPGRQALSHVQNGILEILKQHPQGLQGSEIIDKMGPCNDKSVYNTLNRLVRQNRLHKDAFTRSYRLPEFAQVSADPDRAVVSLFGEQKVKGS